MIKIKNTINSSLFIITFFINSAFSQIQYKKISKVEFYSIDMTIMTKYRLSPEKFMTRSDKFHATYYNSGLVIENVLDNLDNLKPKDDGVPDIRNLIEIYYENGEIETVGINQDKSIVYKGKVYKKNRCIYKNIRKLYPIKRSWLERLMY